MISSESQPNDGVSDDASVKQEQKKMARKSSTGSASSHSSHNTKKSHHSLASKSSTEMSLPKMRKYGKIPFRDPIKKGSTVDKPTDAKKDKEDVATFVKREVFDAKPQGHTIAPTEESLKIAESGIALHDTLLETEVRSAGFDRFDAQYDPHGDLMMKKSFATVQREQDRAARDTGPSISKERFSSKSWGAWRKDVLILESTSAKEVQPQEKQKTRLELLKEKSQKMATFIKQNIPSTLPGKSFAQPKNDSAEYFDYHMQGNRNRPDKIYRHSLGQDPPVAFYKPSMLRAANSDPNRFGHNISGGVVAQGPARGVNPKGVTANVDFPAVDVARGDPKMLSFGVSARQSKVVMATNSGDGAQEPTYDSPSKMPGNKFGEEKRTGGIPDSRRSYPGPGSYDVPGIFDKFEVPDYQSVIEKVEKKGLDFRAIPHYDLAKLAGFGYGCNRQEHVLYGFCLDGNCNQRVEFEKAFLQTNNHKRLGAESKEECQAALPGYEKIVRKEKPVKAEAEKPADLDIFNIDSEAAMRRLQKKYDDKDKIAKDKREFILSLVPDPRETMYPLHMAAIRCDVPALRKMSVLHFDINYQQGEKNETPLQLAVRNQHLKAVQCIVETFDGVVDVDIQNINGDTALHIAARKGFKELVEALTDADANPLLKNSDGCTPLMEASVFTIQQLLRMQMDKFNMRKELQDLSAELEKERQLAAMQEEVYRHGVPLEEYISQQGDTAKDGEISAADMIQYPWRAQIASRGGGTAPSSRASSTRESTRSRLLEVTKNTYDKDVDASKTNKSLFRVARSRTMLKNPKVNSFVLGYWADDFEDQH